MKNLRSTALLAGSAALFLSGTAIAQEEPSVPTARIEQVAAFPHQVTGVTVSEDGRIFVNFPRWTEDSPVSVAEVMRTGRSSPIPTTRPTHGAMPARTR